MKSIFLGLFLLLSTLSWAQGLDSQTVEVSNQVIKNIYDEIDSLKGKYPELENFGQNALSKNECGIYRINYVYQMTDVFDKIQNYTFDVAISVFNGTDYLTSTGEGFFNYDFPLLRVRLLGNQTFVYKTKQLDINKIIKKHLDLLANEQQKKLPFKLNVVTAKESFDRNEDIEFTVTLQNMTDHVLMVKELSAKTVQFSINNQPWGVSEGEKSKSGGNAILKSGEIISRNFKGKGLNLRREFDVLCTYSMSYEGVNPAAMLKVKIVRPLKPISL